MDLVDVLDMARQQYNAVGDTFYADSELLRYAYAGCQELAREALVIENIETISGGSVASQQAYNYPTRVISIKRITYDGKPLKPVNFRDDYALSLDNSATVSTGTPQFYYLWDGQINLRPIPDTSALVIKVYAFKEPAELATTAAVLEIPTMFHTNLVDYILSRMYMKDCNPQMGKMFYEVWRSQGVEAAKKWQRKRVRGDQFAAVQDEETGVITILGKV